MPARLPELEIVPHYEAVMLAHDTPLKRDVILHAEQLMAGPMRLLQLALANNEACLGRSVDYMKELAAHPPRPQDDDEKPRRDPNLVTFAQSNRATALCSALLRDINRLRERCYQQARELAYQQTLKRVGPRFWPSQADAAGIPPDPSEDRPVAGEQTGEGVQTGEGKGEGKGKTARADLPRNSEPAPAPEPDAAFAKLETSTVSKRTLRHGQDEMIRAGVSRSRQIEVARKAKQECWTVGRFYTEVSKLMATEGRVPAEV